MWLVVDGGLSSLTAPPPAIVWTASQVKRCLLFITKRLVEITEDVPNLRIAYNATYVCPLGARCNLGATISGSYSEVGAAFPRVAGSLRKTTFVRPIRQPTN